MLRVSVHRKMAAPGRPTDEDSEICFLNLLQLQRQPRMLLQQQQQEEEEEEQQQEEGEQQQQQLLSCRAAGCVVSPPALRLYKKPRSCWLISVEYLSVGKIINKQ